MSKRSIVAPEPDRRPRHAPGSGRVASPPCERFHANPSKIAQLRRRLIDRPSGLVLAETFKVLGDLTRVQILDALGRAELCVCDLATLVGLSESAVSHQLRLLRSLRVVRSRREGKQVFYALDDEHVTRLFQLSLEHLGHA
jgi:ArsR family transcriptional regulator, lead/cadmium/zinc/bismuth-responsive transcriptional repressor